MNDEMMNPHTLVEKTPDAESLSEMIGFAAQRHVGSRAALPLSMIGWIWRGARAHRGLRPSVAERRLHFLSLP